MTNTMMDVNIRMNKNTKEQRIPFEINNNTYNHETIAAFKEAEDISKNPDMYKGYNSAKEMFEDILKD